MKIELSEWEFKNACDIASLRMAMSISRGANHANVRERDYMHRITDEVLALCGEMAVAKAIGMYLKPTVNAGEKEPDIFPDIEVRSTEHQNGCLIFRKQDSRDRWYFLTTGKPPEIDVIGFIHGSKITNPTWVKNPNSHGDAYFVPQSALHRIGEKNGKHARLEIPV